MRLDIESLRAFKAVVDHGGVTRAAKVLGLSQSAVSHKLARLESRIGRPILMKGEHGILPTSDGQGLLHYAERLISLHDEAAQHFHAQPDLTGQIRLGATEDATSSELAKVLGRFDRVHPNVSLYARVAQSLMLNLWLTTGEIDVAILQTFTDEIEPGDIELWREDLIWVRSVDHPPQLGESIAFVSFDSNSFYKLAAMRHLTAAGRSLRIVLECPGKEGVRAGIKSGFGIGLLGRSNLEEGLTELVSDLPAMPCVSHVLRSRGALSPRLERNFVDAILLEMKQDIVK